MYHSSSGKCGYLLRSNANILSECKVEVLKAIMKLEDSLRFSKGYQDDITRACRLFRFHSGDDPEIALNEIIRCTEAIQLCAIESVFSRIYRDQVLQCLQKEEAVGGSPLCTQKQKKDSPISKDTLLQSIELVRIVFDNPVNVLRRMREEKQMYLPKVYPKLAPPPPSTMIAAARGPFDWIRHVAIVSLRNARYRFRHLPELNRLTVYQRHDRSRKGTLVAGDSCPPEVNVVDIRTGKSLNLLRDVCGDTHTTVLLCGSVS